MIIHNHCNTFQIHVYCDHYQSHVRSLIKKDISWTAYKDINPFLITGVWRNWNVKEIEMCQTLEGNCMGIRSLQKLDNVPDGVFFLLLMSVFCMSCIWHQLMIFWHTIYGIILKACVNRWAKCIFHKYNNMDGMPLCALGFDCLPTQTWSLFDVFCV